jgi:hypothetical protein
VDEIYDSTAAAIFSVLTLPGVLPALAVGVLVFGLLRARRAPRPVRYAFGAITIATALMCFSLLPAYATYVHARGVSEVWFWLLLGLVGPFVLLGVGLQVMASANKPTRDNFWDAG